MENNKMNLSQRNEREVRYGSIQFREESEKEDRGYYILEGNPVVFDQKTCLGQGWDGNDIYEVMEKDCFKDADISDVVFNVNHGEGNHAVARTRNGTLSLETRDDGVHCTIKLDKSNPRCVQVYKDVKSGLLDKMSFAFTIKEESYDKEERCYHVRKIDKVYDVSAVEFPAYGTTSISARRASEAVAERKRAVAREVETKKELLIRKIVRSL